MKNVCLPLTSFSINVTHRRGSRTFLSILDQLTPSAKYYTVYTSVHIISSPIAKTRIDNKKEEETRTNKNKQARSNKHELNQTKSLIHPRSIPIGVNLISRQEAPFSVLLFRSSFFGPPSSFFAPPQASPRLLVSSFLFLPSSFLSLFSFQVLSLKIKMS